MFEVMTTESENKAPNVTFSSTYAVQGTPWGGHNTVFEHDSPEQTGEEGISNLPNSWRLDSLGKTSSSLGPDFSKTLVYDKKNCSTVTRSHQLDNFSIWCKAPQEYEAVV